MRSGKLRYRVRLQRVERTPDGIGGHTEQWADLATVWAHVEPLEGRERFDAQSIEHELTHRIRARYRPDVEAGMRVLHRDQVLTVESALDRGGMRRELELLCLERGAE